jgi:hypothetical protein
MRSRKLNAAATGQVPFDSRDRARLEAAIDSTPAEERELIVEGVVYLDIKIH